MVQSARLASYKSRITHLGLLVVRITDIADVLEAMGADASDVIAFSRESRPAWQHFPCMAVYFDLRSPDTDGLYELLRQRDFSMSETGLSGLAATRPGLSAVERQRMGSVSLLVALYGLH